MFTINNQEWKIEFTNPFNEVFLQKDGNYTIGMCDNNEKIIYLAEDLTGRLLKKVLCHEIVHAAMFSYNISLTYDQEELLADIIATYGDEIIDVTNKVFKKLQQF